MYVFGKAGACRTSACICVAAEIRKRRRETERGLLCGLQGPRGGRRDHRRLLLFRSFVFYPSEKPGIAVSKAAARKSKTKVSFFSLEGPGYGTATIHSLPSLPTPFFSYYHSLLPSSSSSPFPPFSTAPAVSCCCCCFYRPPPTLFPCSMYYLCPTHCYLPLVLSLSLSFSLSASLLSGFCLKELVLAHFDRSILSFSRRPNSCTRDEKEIERGGLSTEGRIGIL